MPLNIILRYGDEDCVVHDVEGAGEGTQTPAGEEQGSGIEHLKECLAIIGVSPINSITIFSGISAFHSILEVFLRSAQGVAHEINHIHELLMSCDLAPPPPAIDGPRSVVLYNGCYSYHWRDMITLVVPKVLVVWGSPCHFEENSDQDMGSWGGDDTALALEDEVLGRELEELHLFRTDEADGLFEHLFYQARRLKCLKVDFPLSDPSVLASVVGEERSEAGSEDGNAMVVRFAKRGEQFAKEAQSLGPHIDTFKYTRSPQIPGPKRVVANLLETLELSNWLQSPDFIWAGGFVADIVDTYDFRLASGK